jgi:hypothetical protein
MGDDKKRLAGLMSPCTTAFDSRYASAEAVWRV